MAKAVLVFDMTENCRNIKGDSKHGCLFGGMNCLLSGEDVMPEVAIGIRSSTCPLRPLPEKDNTKYWSDEYADGWKEGWNECLDAITGGAEDE